MKQLHERIVENLRQKGYRMTATRSSLILLFCETNNPLSVESICLCFQKSRKKFHKVTIYREIDFLLQAGVLTQVVFGDRKKRYELADLPHHHHLVCTKCHAVQDIPMQAKWCDIEGTIFRKKRFAVTHHSLEFFGFCSACGI